MSEQKLSSAEQLRASLTDQTPPKIPLFEIEPGATPEQTTQDIELKPTPKTSNPVLKKVQGAALATVLGAGTLSQEIRNGIEDSLGKPRTFEGEELGGLGGVVDGLKNLSDEVSAVPKKMVDGTKQIVDTALKQAQGVATTATHLAKALPEKALDLSGQVGNFGLKQAQGAVAATGIYSKIFSQDIKDGIAESWGTKKIALPKTSPENISIQEAPVLQELYGVTLEENAPKKDRLARLKELLTSIDQGGVPAFISNNLKRIAAENNIAIETTDTPADVIEKLRDKYLQQGETFKNISTPTPTSETIAPQIQKPERKRILSDFEKDVTEQTSIEDLAEFLTSKNYKDRMFGSGTRAVSGANLAKIISEKVLQAKKGSQVDPYFFIPDAILANKLHELLETSLSWQEIVSEFGTLSFEKKDSEVKEEAAQKATEMTIRKIEAATNPGMWKKIKTWTKENKYKAGAGVVASALLPKLFAFFLGGATEQKDPHVPNNQENRQVIEQNKNTSETKKVSEASTEQERKTFIDPKTGDTFTVEKPASATSKPDAQPLATNAPAEIPTQPEVNVIPIVDTPDYISGQPQSVTDTPDYISPKKEISTEKSLAEPFFSAEPEKPVVAQEKPKQFYSVNEMRNWFSQDKQKLAAFERVLHYADGQEEKGANGQPNVRAFWWETMQLEKVSTILPNKARSQNRNLTHKYVNYHIRESGSRDSIIELRGLDDNQFMTTGAKLRDFDTWYKNSLFPATQQLEQKITQEEKEGLADTTQTLGEYLTQVVYLGEKYGVQIKGIPELTEAQQQKVRSFQPTEVRAEVSSGNRENVVTQEKASPTENTYWADSALQNASLRGVGNSPYNSNLTWLNGPYENMVRQYWDIQKDMKINRHGYTLGELQYLKGQFEELRRRADSLGTNGTAFIIGNFSEKASLRQVDKILEDIETQLGAFQ